MASMIFLLSRLMKCSIFIQQNVFEHNCFFTFCKLSFTKLLHTSLKPYGERLNETTCQVFFHKKRKRIANLAWLLSHTLLVCNYDADSAWVEGYFSQSKKALTSPFRVDQWKSLIQSRDLAIKSRHSEKHFMGESGTLGFQEVETYRGESAPWPSNSWDIIRDIKTYGRPLLIRRRGMTGSSTI